MCDARSDWQSLLWLLSRDHKPLIYAVSRGASQTTREIDLSRKSDYRSLLGGKKLATWNFHPVHFWRRGGASRWDRVLVPRKREKKNRNGKGELLFSVRKARANNTKWWSGREGERSRVSKYSRLIQPNSRWIKTLPSPSPRHDPGGISNSRPQYDQSPTARYPSSFSTPVELLDFKCLPLRAIAAHIDARTRFSTMTSCSLLILIKWQPCSVCRRVRRSIFVHSPPLPLPPHQ